MKKKNEIKLAAEQRKELEKFSKTGVHSAKLIKRAEIILLLDTSGSEKAVTFDEISKRLNVSTTTITKVKKDFLAAENIKAFLQRKKRNTPPVEPKITADLQHLDYRPRFVLIIVRANQSLQLPRRLHIEPGKNPRRRLAILQQLIPKRPLKLRIPLPSLHRPLLNPKQPRNLLLSTLKQQPNRPLLTAA